MIYFLTFFLNDLKVDLFYENFTTIHKGSIITGTSRARYAIDPKFLNDSLSFKNLSFTRSKSPYNTSYTNFLINYTNQSPNRVSIFCVSPISFEKLFKLNEEYFQIFDFEKGDFKKVNFEYLFKEKITPAKIVSENVKLFLRKIVFGKNHEFDNRIITNLHDINEYVDDYPIPNKLNCSYLKNLQRLIQHFSKTSKVILIRMPIRQELYNKEKKLIPFFNRTIEVIAKENDVSYFDLNQFEFNPDLRFYDISHLNKNEAKRITKLIDSLIYIK